MSDFSGLKSLWAGMKSRPNATWKAAHRRLQPVCAPEIRHSFQVPAKSTVFTIGSCFARNIEMNLSILGYDVPMVDFDLPDLEKGTQRAAGILNKYTPAAIYQELAWTKSILDRDSIVTREDCETFCYSAGGVCMDNQIHSREMVSLERMVQRRQEIFDAFSVAFRADCVVMTMGLTETLRDRRTGVYVTNSPATHSQILEDLDDVLEFENLSFETCRDFMQLSISLLRAANPDVKILLTVSPVPLSSTFTEDDVIVANMHSKCTLRAVAGAITAADGAIDYFPAFERVMLTRDWGIFEKDLRHVTSIFVSQIVEELSKGHFAADAEGQAAIEEFRTGLRNAADFVEDVRERLDAVRKQGDMEATKAVFAETLNLIHEKLTDEEGGDPQIQPGRLINLLIEMAGEIAEDTGNHKFNADILAEITSFYPNEKNFLRRLLRARMKAQDFAAAKTMVDAYLADTEGRSPFAEPELRRFQARIDRNLPKG